MVQFQYGDFKAKIDTTDYMFQEKLETLYEKLDAQTKEPSQGGKTSAYILKFCKAVFAFFDGLFGDGTSKEIFGDAVNMRVCDDALYALSMAISKDLKQYRDSSKKRGKVLSAQMNAITGKQK